MSNRVIRFECQPGCTACCRQKGFVYLTPDDLVRIAEYLGMAPAEFERRYVYRTRNKMRLRKPRKISCPFLLEGGCSIHAVKPTQCRIFPYWPELVRNRREWQRTARYCPGIGQGELVRIEFANRQAKEMREAYPSLYRGGR